MMMTKTKIQKRTEENSTQDLPLIKALQNPDRPPANPLDAFKLARKAWVNGERVSIGKIAQELDVSRVTIYRWVGSRDRLIEEILWSLAQPLFQDCIKKTPGTGVDHIVGVHRRLMIKMAHFDPMVQYIRQYPVAAIKLQSAAPQFSHGRLIKAAALHMQQQIDDGFLQIPIPAEQMAEMIVVTNGSLLYSAIIGNRKTGPAIEQACTIDRMMLMGAFIEASVSQ